jgi:hypothetical protein
MHEAGLHNGVVDSEEEVPPHSLVVGSVKEQPQSWAVDVAVDQLHSSVDGFGEQELLHRGVFVGWDTQVPLQAYRLDCLAKRVLMALVCWVNTVLTLLAYTLAVRLDTVLN